MNPTTHAVALLAIVGVTLLACIGLRGKPQSSAGLIAGAACFLMSLLMPGHLCDAGHPWSQLLIGSACITMLIVFVRDRRVALGLSFVIAVSAGKLAWDYVDLVHVEGVTGNRNPSQERMRIRSERLARETLAEMAKSDSKSYPEGWLSDSEIRPDKVPFALTRVDVSPFWHSWFTGLYSCRRRDGSLWYPGGKLADAAPRVEWRERDFR
jgi:hypothetical protein